MVSVVEKNIETLLQKNKILKTDGFNPIKQDSVWQLLSGSGALAAPDQQWTTTGSINWTPVRDVRITAIRMAALRSYNAAASYDLVPCSIQFGSYNPNANAQGQASPQGSVGGYANNGFSYTFYFKNQDDLVMKNGLILKAGQQYNFRMSAYGTFLLNDIITISANIFYEY